MNKFSQKIDMFNALLGKVLCWLCLAVVAITFFKVLGRYIFGEDSAWQSELVLFAHSLVFLGMSGFALKENSHVRVDVFYQKLSLKNQAWVNLLGAVFLLLPFCITLAYFSWGFVAASWQILESSREDNGIGAVYIAKSFLLVFCATLFLQGLSEAIKSWYIIRSKNG
jgi:TRAP-type mannitol/chloroaromatic compound transport system permease small subunit